MSTTREKVILLSRFGMAAEEIATAIGISVSNVYYHLRKVRRSNA